MATATNPEDVGYETARIKGVDVLGQVSVMLRQRGCRIESIGGLPVEGDFAAPLAEVPTEQVQNDSEAWVQRMLARPGVRVSTCSPWQPVLVAAVPDSPPAGTAAHTHLLRGSSRPGELTWVFLLSMDKVRVKHLRSVHDSYAALPAERLPRRVLVISREKIHPTSAVALRGKDKDLPLIPERFLLSELSHNVTRHFLVPRHRLCAPDEVARLKKQFPKLALQSREDMISRYHGMVAGDVIIYHRQRLGSFGGEYFREVA